MVGAAGSILQLPRGPLDRYSALPVEIYNYARQPDHEIPAGRRRRYPDPGDDPALDERRRHRDSQPIQALSLTSFTAAAALRRSSIRVDRSRTSHLHEIIDERLRNACRP